MKLSEVGEPHSKKYKGNPTNNQYWSNLTPDLLSFIITKLHFADRIRFRSVCKDWHNIPIGDRPINELPWVITHTNLNFQSCSAVSVKESSRLVMSDPLQKKTHTMPSNFPGIVAKYFIYFGDLAICSSKFGWLLLANCMNDTVVDLFLYSPFKHKVITLPPLSMALSTYHSLCRYFDKATFSSTNSTSPNCVFFVVHCLEHGKLGISSYRYGDNDWRIKIVQGDLIGQLVASLVCTENGVCYFVLECGKLGAFCVETQECTWLANSVWTPSDNMYLVEFNGDVLLAKCSFTYNRWKVFRYDVNERGWIKQKTLGDRALFLCSCSSYLRPATADTADLADKIIYHHHHKYDNKREIRVYSLKDGKRYNKSRAYGWMVKDSLRKVFIEPPY